MTYEEIEHSLKGMTFTYEGESYEGESFVLKTITLFHNCSGYKLAARWSHNLDFSSKYHSSLEEAYQEIVTQAMKHFSGEQK